MSFCPVTQSRPIPSRKKLSPSQKEPVTHLRGSGTGKCIEPGSPGPQMWGPMTCAGWAHPSCLGAATFQKEISVALSQTFPEAGWPFLTCQRPQLCSYKEFLLPNFKTQFLGHLPLKPFFWLDSPRSTTAGVPFQPPPAVIHNRKV